MSVDQARLVELRELHSEVAFHVFHFFHPPSLTMNDRTSLLTSAQQDKSELGEVMGRHKGGELGYAGMKAATVSVLRHIETVSGLTPQQLERKYPLGLKADPFDEETGQAWKRLSTPGQPGAASIEKLHEIIITAVALGHLELDYFDRRALGATGNTNPRKALERVETARQQFDQGRARLARGYEPVAPSTAGGKPRRLHSGSKIAISAWTDQLAALGATVDDAHAIVNNILGLPVWSLDRPTPEAVPNLSCWIAGEPAYPTALLEFDRNEALQNCNGLQDIIDDISGAAQWSDEYEKWCKSGALGFDVECS